MSTVRIRPEAWKRINEIAVRATLLIQTPVKQSEVTNSILEMKFSNFSNKELAAQLIDHLREKNEKL